MNKIKTLLVTGLMAIGLLGAPLLATAPAFAATNPQEQACRGTGGTFSGGECRGNSSRADLTAIVARIVNVLLYIIGAVAVIAIIIGALRYVTSAGDASKVKAAKDTILYAVIGLVIGILAYAIVNFVVGAL